MSNLSDIKRRLISVKQTRQITGAMETVSIAKMRKANERLADSRHYVDLLYGMVGELARISGSDGPLFSSSAAVGKKILLVVTSDKGLCGGFDHEIFKRAEEYADKNTVFMPIGVIGGEYYKNKENTDMRFASSYIPDYNNAETVAVALLEEYAAGASEIAVVYTVHGGAADMSTVKRILPVSGEICAAEGTSSESGLEPFKNVFEKIVPLYVACAVYDAFLNNSASEHGARRQAIMAATESADALIAQLSTEYNRARQSAVTEQIIEIIGATSALTEKRS